MFLANVLVKVLDTVSLMSLMLTAFKSLLIRNQAKKQVKQEILINKRITLIKRKKSYQNKLQNIKLVWRTNRNKMKQIVKKIKNYKNKGSKNR